MKDIAFFVLESDGSLWFKRGLTRTFQDLENLLQRSQRIFIGSASKILLQNLQQFMFLQ